MALPRCSVIRCDRPPRTLSTTRAKHCQHAQRCRSCAASITARRMDKPANGSGIGAPVRRREDLRLVRGAGRYTADENLPGQAYAVMVRSAHAHALIRGIAKDAALAVPGVLAVLTGADALADGLNPVPHKPWSPHPAETPLRNAGGRAPLQAP